MASKKPLHITLRQYRVFPVAVTGFMCLMFVDMWQWFKENYSGMNEWVNLAFAAMVGPVLGTIKWAVESTLKRSESDEHDD